MSHISKKEDKGEDLYEGVGYILCVHGDQKIKVAGIHVTPPRDKKDLETIVLSVTKW